MIDTTTLTDSVSEHTGIPNFCGKYVFSVSENSELFAFADPTIPTFSYGALEPSQEGTHIQKIKVAFEETYATQTPVSSTSFSLAVSDPPMEPEELPNMKPFLGNLPKTSTSFIDFCSDTEATWNSWALQIGEPVDVN